MVHNGLGNLPDAGRSQADFVAAHTQLKLGCFQWWKTDDHGLGCNKLRFPPQPTPPAKVCASNRESQGIRGMGKGKRRKWAANCWYPSAPRDQVLDGLSFFTFCVGWPRIAEAVWATQLSVRLPPTNHDSPPSLSVHSFEFDQQLRTKHVVCRTVKQRSLWGRYRLVWK